MSERCKGLARDCFGERTEPCHLGATVDGYCKLHHPDRGKPVAPCPVKHMGFACRFPEGHNPPHRCGQYVVGDCLCAALTARVAELEKALQAIRDYDRMEVCKDEFAYDRLQEAYRDCARAALDGKGEK